MEVNCFVRVKSIKLHAFVVSTNGVCLLRTAHRYYSLNLLTHDRAHQNLDNVTVYCKSFGVDEADCTTVPIQSTTHMTYFLSLDDRQKCFPLPYVLLTYMPGYRAATQHFHLHTRAIEIQLEDLRRSFYRI